MSDEQFSLKTKAKKSWICKIQQRHMPMELTVPVKTAETGLDTDQH